MSNIKEIEEIRKTVPTIKIEDLDDFIIKLNINKKVLSDNTIHEIIPVELR